MSLLNVISKGRYIGRESSDFGTRFADDHFRFELTVCRFIIKKHHNTVLKVLHKPLVMRPGTARLVLAFTRRRYPRGVEAI